MTFAKCAMALFAGSVLWPLASAAQPLKSQAPIVIDADSGVRNERTGVTEYIGNVNIAQGDLSIAADRVTILYQDNQVATIRCEGDPAIFRQHVDVDNDHLVGMAQSIDYSLLQQTIDLTSNASLSRNGTNLKGDTIHYDLKNQIRRARGNDTADQKRIQLVIPPSTSIDPETPVERDATDTQP